MQLRQVALLAAAVLAAAGAARARIVRPAKPDPFFYSPSAQSEYFSLNPSDRATNKMQVSDGYNGAAYLALDSAMDDNPAPSLCPPGAMLCTFDGVNNNQFRALWAYQPTANSSSDEYSWSATNAFQYARGDDYDWCTTGAWVLTVKNAACPSDPSTKATVKVVFSDFYNGAYDCRDLSGFDYTGPRVRAVSSCEFEVWVRQKDYQYFDQFRPCGFQPFGQHSGVALDFSSAVSDSGVAPNQAANMTFYTSVCGDVQATTPAPGLCENGDNVGCVFRGKKQNQFYLSLGSETEPTWGINADGNPFFTVTDKKCPSDPTRLLKYTHTLACDPSATGEIGNTTSFDYSADDCTLDVSFATSTACQSVV